MFSLKDFLLSLSLAVSGYYFAGLLFGFIRGLLVFFGIMLVSFLMDRIVGFSGSTKANLGMTILATTLSIFFIDVLIFKGVVHIRPALELPVLPFQKKFVTRSGYFTGVHEANFFAEAEIPGPAANHLEDSGFYEPRYMKVETDELGLRNPVGSAQYRQDIILMGDSFAFGYATTQSKVAARVIESEARQHVYNLGVYGASPSQQIELLYHLLEDENTLKVSPHPSFVLMFFEGNDYTDHNVYKYDQGGVRAIVLKAKDFLNRFRARTTTKMIAGLLNRSESVNSVSFQALDSERFGIVSFANDYVERAARLNSSDEIAEKAVKDAMLGKAMARFKTLGGKYNARTIVLYVPTKPRVYQPYYAGLSDIGERDRAKEFLRVEAEANGVEFVDFYNTLAAHAESGELLYWRDDTHLNNEGNRLLASLVIDLIKE